MVNRKGGEYFRSCLPRYFSKSGKKSNAGKVRVERARTCDVGCYTRYLVRYQALFAEIGVAQGKVVYLVPLRSSLSVLQIEKGSSSHSCLPPPWAEMKTVKEKDGRTVGCFRTQDSSSYG